MAIEFRPGRSDESPGREMMGELNDLLDAQYPGRAAKPGSVTSPDEMVAPGGVFLVGYEDDRPVAGGGVRRLEDGICEIKRMYVVPGARSRGVGRALLAALEDAARELGYGRVRLDAGPAQTRSRALFEKTGYAEIAKYNDNHIAVYFAEKQLAGPDGAAKANASEATEAEAGPDAAAKTNASKATEAEAGPDAAAKTNASKATEAEAGTDAAAKTNASEATEAEARTDAAAKANAGGAAEANAGEATEANAGEAAEAEPAEDNVSDELERWLGGDDPRTLGSLIDTFGERSFAIVFALLMALPALPLPTGGATHVLEVITMLLSLELIAGRREIWLPQRWRRIELGGAARQKVITMLLKRIRWLERYSRPRGQWLFGHRLSGIVFGFVTLGLTITAFLAPPFSGLDTLPSIGVVVLAVGVLLTDVVLATAGFVVGALGVVATIGFGSLVVKAMKSLF